MRPTLILLLAVFTLSAKIPVYVCSNSSDDDIVGQCFVYKVKENIRSSIGMSLVHSGVEANFQLKIMTLDLDAKGDCTIYSAVILINNGVYLTNMLGVCGANKIDVMAKSLVADIDNAIQSYFALTKHNQLK